MAMQATNEGIGRSLGQVICNVVPDCSGEIAILSSDPNAPNLSVWVKWAQEELKGDKYKNLKVVDVAYGGETDAGAYTRAQELIKAHPNLAGLIVPGSVQVAAAARAIKDEGMSGKVQLTGLGLPSELKSYVADGTIKQFVFWNPSDLGYLAVYMVHGLIDGSVKADKGTSFTAGKLGSFEVGDDGIVLLGAPLVVDEKNVDSLKF
jgi:rhamnose transport system substrate-binding protein